MGISYNATTATITVTGGSYTEPFSMADIIANGTAGAYVATGGYGGREATVSANLVIGSTTGSTFYDPTGYITKEASGYKLTVYHHSLRCAKMSDTWASRTFGDAIPATDVRDRMLRSEVLMMYVEVKGFLCPSTGELMRATGPEAVPPLETLGAPAGVTTLSPLGQDPCAFACSSGLVGLPQLGQLANAGVGLTGAVPVSAALEAQPAQKLPPANVIVLVGSSESVIP